MAKSTARDGALPRLTLLCSASALGKLEAKVGRVGSAPRTALPQILAQRLLFRARERSLGKEGARFLQDMLVQAYHAR